MLQDEEIGRPEAEHHQWMAIEAIAQPAPEGAGTVLLDSERLDVAHAAAVEIAGGGVVRGVCVAPHVVRCEGQHTSDAAEPVVGQAVTEEGAVAAIMLDGEKPHEEAGGGDRQRQGQPIADVECCPGQHPKRGERHDRDGDLDEAAAGARLPVAGEDLGPRTRVPRGRGGSRGILTTFQPESFPVQYGTGIDLCDLLDLETDGDKSNEAKRLSTDASQETMAICRHLSAPRGAGRSGWRRPSAAGSRSSG